MVLAVALLLARVVETRIFGMLHTFKLYLSRLRWLLASRILLKRFCRDCPAASMMATYSGVYIF
jgi:hypothetical protein